MKKAKFSWDGILKTNFDSQLHKRTESSLGPYNETFQGHNWIQILGSHQRRSVNFEYSGSSGNGAIQLHDQYHVKYLKMKKAKYL